MVDEEIVETEEITEESEDIMDDTDETSFPVYTGECKKFHQEPYFTPNNYDIYFDQNNIPSNIKPEPAASLQKRLQKLVPATKYIHLNMDSEVLNQTSHILISSKLRINNQEVKFI